MIEQLMAILPQLIIATGIVLSLLLVAWRRSQKMIASFVVVILALTTISIFDGFSLSPTQVTPLLFVDDFSRFALLWLLVASFGGVYLAYHELSRCVEVHDEFYLLLLLALLGASVLVVSDHFASLFLGFEVLSIALVGLVGYFRKSAHSVEASFKYLILSASASSFMLLGIAFIYAQTGSLTFAPLTNAGHPLSVLYQLGLILFFSGVAFKLSLVPFHWWTPDVYQGAPSSVTFLLASMSKCAMFVVLIKCFYQLNTAILFEQSDMGFVVFAIALLSMLAGNILAIGQQSIKRILAYSSIAHMGYLAMLLFVYQHSMMALGKQSLLFYLFAYILATLAIFSVLTLADSKSNNEDQTLEHWRGLFWQSPLKAAVIIIAILSFAGMPLTMGFIGKFYLITVAAQQSLWWLLTALIVGSSIALSYYLPMIFTLFKQVDDLSVKIEREHLAQKSWWLLMLTLPIILGVFPDIIAQYLLMVK